MPDPDGVLRVGILGTGWVAGDRHFPAYHKHPRARVVAVCDRHREKAQAFAAARGIPWATDSITDFLNGGLDLVSVCTPPFAHHAGTIAALEAGCHVFVEKPMAMALGQAEDMARVAEQQGRLLCVSHNFLYTRSITRLRRMLDSGAVGRIQFVIGVQVSSPRRRLPSWYGDLPAGLFFDEAPHLLYLLAGLLGEVRVVAATAEPATPGSHQPVRSVHAVLSSAVAPATVTMTFDAPVSEWHLIVVGERRVLMADLFRDICVAVASDGAHRAAGIIKTATSVGVQYAAGLAASGGRFAARTDLWGHESLVPKVVQSVLDGVPSPVPVAQSLQVVQVTDAILRSIGQSPPVAPGHRGPTH